jgi:putative tryptophan/tyrosine transport system substrate-binding protein
MKPFWISDPSALLRTGFGSSIGKSQSKKFLCLALCAVLLALCVSAQAQQPGKIPRIGYVSGTGDANNPGPNIESFRQGLRDLGYVEGKNIVVEYRYAEGKNERLPGLVAEIVKLKVDVVVVIALPAIRAAKKATQTIPIVMVTNTDPVAAGLVDSLARPGGNVTGLTLLTRDLSGKRLELLNEMLPGISRVGILWVTPSSTGDSGFREYEATARALKIRLQSLEVQGSNPDLEGAFHAAAKGRANALITIRNPALTRHTKQIVDLAIKTRLPSMFESTDYVEAGGLVSYAANFNEVFRRASVFVDKILKGAKPTDLPVEQPTKFEFAINLKTAKALNLTIPQSVLFRADRVIKEASAKAGGR